MKWEYRVECACDCLLTANGFMNSMGEDGWELVCVYQDNVIFKRRKAETKKIEVIVEHQADDKMFEECWIAYNRRGSKALAKAQWAKLSDEDKTKVLPHVKEYVASVSEVKYQVYFERYLRDKRFLDVVHGAKPQTLFSEPQSKTKEEKLIIGGTIYR